MVTLLTFGQFPVRAVEVVPNVVDHVPGELQQLEDHDDGHAGEQAKGATNVRYECGRLKNEFV